MKYLFNCAEYKNLLQEAYYGNGYSHSHRHTLYIVDKEGKFDFKGNMYWVEVENCLCVEDTKGNCIAFNVIENN